MNLNCECAQGVLHSRELGHYLGNLKEIELGR